MDDLTIVYYTANRAKPALMKAVIDNLRVAAGDSPIVSVSHEPMDLGRNLCVGPRRQHVWNIYSQMLLGARAAKTYYVAAAEDDILYSYEHFNTYCPMDTPFLYDTNRWLLFTYKEPMFSRKDRIITGMLIAERKYLIEALEERLEKYPTPESIDINVFGEIGRNEKELGVTVREVERFRAPAPSIMLNHEDSITYAHMGKHKASGITPTRWLAPWGSAVGVMGLCTEQGDVTQ